MEQEIRETLTRVIDADSTIRFDGTCWRSVTRHPLGSIIAWWGDDYDIDGNYLGVSIIRSLLTPIEYESLTGWE